MVAYVPNWIELDEFSQSIDYEHLTHINIAFENPIDEQGQLSFNAKNANLIQRAHERGVKVLVSIGGGSAATDTWLMKRYKSLLSEEKRNEFAQTLVTYIKEHQFDGLDVDIEGPSITADYGPFIESLHAALKPHGLLLTAALSQGYGGANVPSSSIKLFDFVNIMAYDGKGSWDPNSPGQHSSMEFTKRNVDYWLERGLPKSAAVVGVPFYGYGFGDDFKKGGLSYKSILAKHPDAAMNDKVGQTIWHNGIITMKQKTQYALDQELGGLMIWSLDNDVSGEQSLLKAIVDTINMR